MNILDSKLDQRSIFLVSFKLSRYKLAREKKSNLFYGSNNPIIQWFQWKSWKYTSYAHFFGCSYLQTCHKFTGVYRQTRCLIDGVPFPLINIFKNGQCYPFHKCHSTKRLMIIADNLFLDSFMP